MPDPSPTPGQIESHSFYRIPPAASHVQLPPFDGNLPLSNESQPRELSRWLATLREVFAKNTLSTNDLMTLRDTAYFLLHHASRWSPADFDKLTPHTTLEQAARRFLVADGVWCICAVVGPAMNQKQWWDRFIDHVVISETAVEQFFFKHRIDRRPLMRRFRNAIEEYRQRRRPEAEEIVSLKRTIFCNSRFHHRFRAPPWDAWRQDDEDFIRGLEVS